MYRRYNLAHLILAVVVVLGLMLLTVDVDAQAQIAFSSERDGNPEIYVMDADGKNQRRLTNNDFPDTSPSWSPDGRQIIFVSDRNHNIADKEEPIVIGGGIIVGDMRKRPQIYVMDADGKNQHRLSNEFVAEWHPSWSPDGRRIVFTSSGTMDVAGGHWRIYVMDADGGNKQHLSNDGEDDYYPAWSPDGERIAFVSIRDGRGNLDIYVMDADGSNQQRLTENPDHEWEPAWSPDGTRIAFTSSKQPDVIPANSDIYVIDADGKNRRKLTRNPSRNTDPSWSPDGERIVFVSDRDGNYEIYVMNADGARQVRRRTKDGSEDTDPTWFDPAFAVEIAPFAVAPAGKKFTMWGRLKAEDFIR